ncbi:MAG: YggT family protein [Desulfobacterales bacterium]|nr:YggT family protein [Desulfobacterales bacterium]
MFIISNFLEAVAVLIDYALNIFMWIIIIRAVLSWVSPDPYNPIVRFIHNATEPILYKIREKLPVSGIGGIDLSPVIVILLIILLQKFIVGSLYGLARAL